MSTWRMNAEREGETQVEVNDRDQKDTFAPSESKEGDKHKRERNK